MQEVDSVLSCNQDRHALQAHVENHVYQWTIPEEDCRYDHGYKKRFFQAYPSKQVKSVHTQERKHCGHKHEGKVEKRGQIQSPYTDFKYSGEEI